MKRIHLILVFLAFFLGSLPLQTARATPTPGDPELVGLVEIEPVPFLEFQFSPIITFAGSDIDDFGYGLQAAVFPGEEIGLQLDYVNFSDAGIDSITCSIVQRHIGSILEPYVFAGGGVLEFGETEATWHAGVGLNYWVTASFAVLAEVRYTWISSPVAGQSPISDYPSLTIGGRWSF